MVFYLFFFFVFFVKVRRREARHAFKVFKGKKEWNFDGGGRAKKREFCVQEFFFWSFFLSFDMPRLYMYGRQQTTTVFGALLSFIITHKIVVLFRSFEDKGDDGGV